MSGNYSDVVSELIVKKKSFVAFENRMRPLEKDYRRIGYRRARQIAVDAARSRAIVFASSSAAVTLSRIERHPQLPVFTASDPQRGRREESGFWRRLNRRIAAEARRRNSAWSSGNRYCRPQMFVVLMIPRLRHRQAVALPMPTISAHLSRAIAAHTLKILA
jgi:hypothetical protein